MLELPFRARQCLISAIGSLIFFPMYLILGGVFSFSFSIYDSIWAWGFGLTACWCQLLAMMTTFFNPRKGAYWLILNTAASLVLAAGYVAESAHGHVAGSSSLEQWLLHGNNLLKAGAIFFAPPLLFAFLLLQRGRDEGGFTIPSAHSERLHG
jgi:hypothetical protein